MSQSLILIDALSSAYWEKEKKRNDQGLFSPGRHMSCWLCHTGISWLLGAVKG
jgi:hypothetical protein